MVEWFKAQHWKCCLKVTLARVRIPLSPIHKLGLTCKKVYLYYISIFASLVQVVERRSPKPDVEGSSPSGRGKIKMLIHIKKLTINYNIGCTLLNI